ncbi:hypothetical protein MNBD_GAMMA14-468 [hydrothermal vent metagenome]|uniref:Uncharacterized protein n=1 Tax=hydrothermal vent metagenome TaxID=652676 RepID=A0A3B0Z8C5_9ZZZZ
MRYITCFNYLITMLLLSSIGLTPAVAEKKPLVSPGLISQPTVKVVPDKSPALHVPSALAPANQAAGQVRIIGEASGRMKQVREMQRLRDLGSPTDQVRPGRSGNDRQDCSRSANRAACLRNNMNAGNTNSLPNGDTQRSMQACLQAGGNPATCGQGRSKGGPAGSATIGNGPGNPADVVNNRSGRGQAEQDGGSSNAHWGQWQSDTDDETGESIKYRTSQNDDGTTTTESHYRNSRTGESGYESVTRDRDGEVLDDYSSSTDRNGVTRDRSTATFNAGNGWTATQNSRTGRPGTTIPIGPPSGTPGNPDNQPSPEGSNGPADNCNWNPALGRCMKPHADTKGMTSRPGPNGENPGTQTGGFAPHVGSAAVTNCGDTGSDACNQGGFGLSSGGTPLDMKDPGQGVPAGGVSK